MATSQQDEDIAAVLAWLPLFRPSDLQEILQERQLQFQSLSGRHVRFAYRQKHAILDTERVVDGDQVIERLPVLRRVLYAAGDEDGAWGHQGMKIDQVFVGVDQLLVEAG